MPKGSEITTFIKTLILNLFELNKKVALMKSWQLHKLIKKNGWRFVKAEGSHYMYEKNGKTYPVPFHGAKEMGKGLEMQIRREMQLK